MSPHFAQVVAAEEEEYSSPVAVVVDTAACPAAALAEELAAMAVGVEVAVAVATAVERVAEAAAAVAARVADAAAALVVAAIAVAAHTAALEGNCSHKVSFRQRSRQQSQLPMTQAQHPLLQGLVDTPKGRCSLVGLDQGIVAVVLEVRRTVACHILKLRFLEEHYNLMEDFHLEAHRKLVAPGFVPVLVAPVVTEAVAEADDLDHRTDFLKPSLRLGSK